MAHVQEQKSQLIALHGTAVHSVSARVSLSAVTTRIRTHISMNTTASVQIEEITVVLVRILITEHMNIASPAPYAKLIATLENGP